MEEELNTNLIKEFPSLKDDFDKYVNWQDGLKTGSTLVYEDIFVPYIIKQLVNNNLNEIEKITNYIESMVNSEDEYTNNVAYIAILESLKSKKEGNKIKNYLKENSFKLFEEINF